MDSLNVGGEVSSTTGVLSSPRLSRLAMLRRTLRTLSHLRVSQLFWRLRYTLRRRQAPRVPAVPAASELIVRTDLPGSQSHESTHNIESFLAGLARGEFAHAGVTRMVGFERPDWRLGPRSTDRLWTITLHYHAWAERLAMAVGDVDLNAALRDEASQLLRHYLFDWLDHCDLTQPGSRDLAWNAYAIATRLGHWARVHRQLTAVNWPWGELGPRFLASMWRQAGYLHANIEWDLRGNHLLRDAVGLAWAGRFFDGAEPRRWLATATQLATSQAREQVMADGGHFERSPMYHHHAMQDFAVLSQLVEDPATATLLRQTTDRMTAASQWLYHRDGEIALFNDATLDIAPVPTKLSATAPGLAVSLSTGAPANGGGHWLRDWGLAVWQGQRWSVFFDVGPVGPDYQPGHAHADTLSIECSYNGRRLFVDPGTFTYDLNANRAYDRSTAAHNTVCVDDTDSNEVWHIFRVGRRARVFDASAAFEPSGMRASATHDGYRFLAGRPMHTRSLQVDETGSLSWVDRITGDGIHRLESSLLLAPAWHVVERNNHGWIVACGQDSLRIEVASESPLALDEAKAAYHPRFGVEEHTKRLHWRYHGPLPVEVNITVGPA